MAKSTLIAFALVFTFLVVMMSTAESRIIPNVADPICILVHAVEEGETCSSISQKFQLDERQFLAINPNINCAGVFVGQWVCINGKVI